MDRAQSRDAQSLGQRTCSRAGRVADARTHRTQTAAAASPVPEPAPARHAAASKPREHVLTALQPAKQAAPAAPVAASDAMANAPAAARPDRGAQCRRQGRRHGQRARCRERAASVAGRKILRPAIGRIAATTRFSTACATRPARSTGPATRKATKWSSRAAAVRRSHSSIRARAASTHFGLAPEQYVEQRGRRAGDITIFNRADEEDRLYAHAGHAAACPTALRTVSAW